RAAAANGPFAIQDALSGLAPTEISRMTLRSIKSTTVTEPLSALAARRNLPSVDTSRRLLLEPAKRGDAIPSKTIAANLAATRRTGRIMRDPRMVRASGGIGDTNPRRQRGQQEPLVD